MNHGLYRRPRVSRETRLLLGAVLLSVAALWILARIRFPDQPAPTPVQPLLTQIVPRFALEDFAGEVARIRPRIEPYLVGSALRVQDNAAILLQDITADRHGQHGDDFVNRDRASGLAVVRVPVVGWATPPLWTPRDLTEPRHLLVADASTGALALRPVFVGTLVATDSPIWREPIWLAPAGTDLPRGAFVFTSDALLAGMVDLHQQQPAIVPARVVLAEAGRLLSQPRAAPGLLGLSVQALTPPIARAVGTDTGVVVAQVDPKGPAAGAVRPGDVVETLDGIAIESPLHWRAIAGRVVAGQPVTLRVRSGGQVNELNMTAAPAVEPAPGRSLGLTLNNRPGVGSLVAEVEAGSTAERGGLRPGDVIVLAGDSKAPSPAAVRRAFERTAESSALLVGLVRDGQTIMTALDK